MIEQFRGEYRFLSNFFPATVVLDGQTYASVEAAYQASKSANSEYRTAIRALGEESGAVKRLGRTMTWERRGAGAQYLEAGRTTLRPDWNEARLSVMLDLVRQKFTRHADLATRLLATGQEELRETNWWRDSFWGVYNGEGENHLGKILMQVRSEIASAA
jgi:hypothetical protein